MNSTVPVPQYIRPREIRRRLSKIGAPQFALAHLADVSDTSLSLCLAGRKMLPWEAQHNIGEVLTFFEQLAERAAPLPVNFGDVPALEPLFKNFKKLHPASEVVGSKA